MSATDKIWVGADPGGKNNFGLAILYPDGSTKTWCVDHADEALEKVCKEVAVAPAGVGVDAPLWWSSGQSSDRQADQWLRRTYGLSGGNVQAANSLKGAAVVQGAMFVHRIREKYPAVGVTESHPKALWAALRPVDWPTFCKTYSISSTIAGHQEHERDAILGAIAAREGFEGRWPLDLSASRHASELDPARYWLAPVHYFWPRT
ncbi:MAG: DUF429 domain-containing protein [Planctomycetes bacterium]|nr:DUF429 domain-containing protein [Planctomycetota bacterium]